MFALSRRGRARSGCCALLIGSALAASGCLRSFTDAPLKVPVEDQAAQENELPSVEELEQRLIAKATRRDPVTKQTTVEVADGWYRRETADDPWIAAPGEYRWQHEGLAKLLKEHSDDAAVLKQAAKSTDKRVRGTALIGLARLEPGRHSAALVKLARDAEMPIGQRRAAIETLASAESIKTEAALRDLIRQYSPTQQGQSAEPLLFAEALVGLGRHCAADQDPIFHEALGASDVDVQLAALAVYAASKSEMLPADVAALAQNQQARVRKAALGALAAGQHSQALPKLRAALKDEDLLVRVGAIELLGQMHDREAVLLLHDLASDTQERHREAAVAALALQEQWPAVERAARDESFRVRQAVANSLAKHGSAARSPLMQQLTKDGSAMVQAAACEALGQWPRDLAVPLLFEAVASPNLLTRQTAQKSLAAHKIACESFNPAATPPQRAEQIAALRSRWQTEHPELAKANAAEIAASTTATSADVVRLVQAFQSADDRSTRWLAQRQLEKLGPPAIAALDAAVQQREISLKENTYRELLPELSPAFAQIEKLRQPEVAQRRAAARKLSQEASAEPLAALAIARLDEVAKNETDPLVIAELFRAAGLSKDCIAHELAVNALAHNDKDVRRRACEYAALCGDKRQVAALEPLVKDSDPLVVRTAVMALGRCGLPRSRESVHALLGHADVNMQVLAAMTLSKWDDPRGPAALQRLAKAKFATTRSQAIGAMAQLGSEEFLPALIDALDDEVSVQIAALGALPKVAGENPLDRLEPKPVSTDDRAREWKAWYAARK